MKKPKTDKRPRKQQLDDARLREIRGATWTDGGITAMDDWEARV
jgi:hypothetical protein